MIAEMQRTSAALALIRRVLPERYGEFAVEWILPVDGGHDVFEIETVGDQIVLRGPNPVSQASALNWFLKYHCDCHIGWDGHQLAPPTQLPRVDRIRIATPYRDRYYLNYVTFSYSMAFWDWSRWEREIDWMALNGINMPLSMTGQEAIWQTVYRQMGLSSAEIQEFLVGPAYLPFGWMGCIDGWGGPLPQRWIDDHADLQKQIVARERELCMRPVLQGFTGHVPVAVGRRFPQSRVHTLRWSDFPSTYFLDPFDPLFRQIGAAFVTEQTRWFGTDHLYAADTFIEMTPPSNDPAFLREMGQALFQGMTDTDPEAVWVLQGWTFSFAPDFWQPTQIEAFLGAVPDDRMIVLDLWAEHEPMWRETRAFYGKPWIWCMLHNFGGRPGVYGPLPVIASAPPEALADPARGNLVGVGLSMEAIEQNPVVYDLMAEMAWRGKTPIDSEAWLRDSTARRYGVRLPEAEQAWEILSRTIYGGESSTGMSPPIPIICARPPLGRAKYALPVEREDLPELQEALRLLFACAGRVGDRTTYRYDLVDVSSEILTRYAERFHAGMMAARDRGDRQAFHDASAAFLKVLRDLEAILATHERFLLGPWIDGARSWAHTPEEEVLYEWNARRLLTLWGSREAELHDYSCRYLSGLVGEFYLPRWEQYVARVEQSFASSSSFDAAAFEDEIMTWEDEWTRRRARYPSTGRGNTVAMVRSIAERYTRSGSVGAC